MHFCIFATLFGKPSNLSEFIKHCGADPSALTKDGKRNMDKVLKEMANQANNLNKKENDSNDAQGTGYLLRDRKISNTVNLKANKTSEDDCRKDTGEKTVHKLSRSRGVLMTVSGGGIIRSWNDLFKSEGPAQVGLLQKYLGENIPDPEDWKNFFLSYDNMCHIDELNLLNKPLALSEPYKNMWQKIQKVIDPLHIKNHTRKQCKTLYNPQKVTEKYKDGNMMQCEQTFAWLGRYKKILNSTPKTHFHFILHRLVVGRNKYTERCYQDGKRPLLPSAKIMK